MKPLRYAIATIALLLCCNGLKAQLPMKVLVGYWQNWNDNSAPFVHLNAINPAYNVIEVSFATPTSSSDMTMNFVPDPSLISTANFISQMQTLQSAGKKVLISIGGANASIDLTTTANKTAFINSMTAILATYGFDGMDLDIEHGASILSSGTITAPTNTAQINLIDAVKQIMAAYRANNSGRKMLLTMAPETVYVMGGMSSFGGNTAYGGYLSIIHALRDSLDLLQVQLYNSGTMYASNGSIYSQATADWVVAMTETVITGFNTWGGVGGYFTGLPANKVAIGLPACPSAAPGGGYMNQASLIAAGRYLRGAGAQPGSYTLQGGPYPGLRGMMTWSVNWDAVNTCNPTSYEYAAAFDSIFASSPLPITLTDFGAAQRDGTALLSWRTAGEEGISRFEVEHGVDGTSFAKIGTTACRGNRLGNAYSFTWPGLFAGIHYFRLKMVGAGGDETETYSKTVVLKSGWSDAGIMVAPNPGTGIVTVSGISGAARVELIDATGKRLAIQHITDAHAQMDIGQYPAGMYMVVVIGEDGSRSQVRIIRQAD